MSEKNINGCESTSIKILGYIEDGCLE